MATTHSRDTPPHYDADLDSVITLATALGVYAQDMDLHTVLSAIHDRVSVLERTVDTKTWEISASAILQRLGYTLTTSLDAIRRTIDNPGSLTSDATIMPRAFADAIIFRTIAPTFGASAHVNPPPGLGFQGDAFQADAFQIGYTFFASAVIV